MWRSIVAFLISNLQAEVTLAAGLWATYAGWCHPALLSATKWDTKQPADFSCFPRIERCIGPVILMFAVAALATGGGGLLPGSTDPTYFTLH